LKSSKNGEEESFLGEGGSVKNLFALKKKRRNARDDGGQKVETAKMRDQHSNLRSVQKGKKG